MLEDILILLGRLHPLIIHLPIGFIVLGLLIEFNKKKLSWSKEGLKFIFFWASLSGLFALLSGILQYQKEGYLWDSIQGHFIAGIATVILSLTFYLHLTGNSFLQFLGRRFFTIGHILLISITGDVNSFLAKNSAVVLSSYVDIEVCPNNLAPTNSTTAQLVIGDALAVTLVKIKGFTSNDFAKFHPGGSLGKKLFLKVKDIVDTDLKPMVTENDNIKDVIIEISNKMLGITPVLSKNSIVGVITDGDLRRTLLNNQEISNLVAGDIMSINPQIIDFEIKAVDALKIMKNNKISQLIVTKDNKYYGVLHIQNIIKEGIS